MRSRPGRSVTSNRPSGKKANPQGCSKLLATVSTRIRAESTLNVQTGSVPANADPKAINITAENFIIKKTILHMA
jgi:hypothetical protein